MTVCVARVHLHFSVAAHNCVETTDVTIPILSARLPSSAFLFLPSLVVPFCSPMERSHRRKEEQHSSNRLHVGRLLGC